MGRGTAELCLIIWLSLSIFLAAIIFSKGFLLSRQVISKKSQLCSSSLPYDDNQNLNDGERSKNTHGNLASMVDWCMSNKSDDGNSNSNVAGQHQPQYSKVILILIDALRFDFIPRMRFLSSTISNARASGKTELHNGKSVTANLYRFMADPPTTTMQRLKALMTGTMPTFIDASANFNSYEVEEDNFIYQLQAAGKQIAFLGDDTWLSLFPEKFFKSPFVEAHPSFNAWDLDTVDRAVNASLFCIMEASEQSKWDVLIAHLLGVDHCGHRYGPKHPEMQRKLDEADSAVEHVFNKMTSDTLLVVFGDHGMTKTGDHGGDSIDEIASGIVFLTKTDNPALEIEEETGTNTVSQIDLAPTLSALTGLPIPFSSIGKIIPGLMNDKFYTNALAANVAQVSRYIESYSTFSNLNSKDKVSLSQAYSQVEDAYLQKSTEFTQRAINYLERVKEVAVNTWTQFDFVSIYLGILLNLLFLGLLYSFLITQDRRRNTVRTICVSCCTVVSLSGAWFFISTAGVLIIVLSGICGMTVFLKTSPSALHFKVPVPEKVNSPEYLALVVYLFTCLAVFSNSFVINEGYVLGSALLVVALIQVLSSVIPRTEIGGIDDPRVLLSLTRIQKPAGKSFFVLAVIVRLGTLFFRCREELVDCQEEFLLHKHLPSLPADWVVHKYVRYGEALLSLAILVVSFRHHMMTRNCIASSRPAAVISKYIPSVLVVLTCAYWALQGLPFGIPQIAQSRSLSYIPAVFQSLTLLSMFIVWMKPISCIGRARNIPSQVLERMAPPRDKSQSPSQANKKSRKVSFSSNSVLNSVTTRSRVNGHFRTDGQETETVGLKSSLKPIESSNFENGSISQPQPEKLSEDVFSSTILSNGILLTLLSVQISSAGLTPVITMIPYAAVCLFNISSSCLRSRIGSWPSVVSWTLASQYFFYATGHQAVFSAIPWDSAFIGTSDSIGNLNDSWLSWVRPALAVLGNLHVSQLIFSASLPLLVYWRGGMNSVPETLMGYKEKQQAYVLGGKFILLHGLKLLTCIFCATLHRRHLMVWKIFAPKFIFEGISFLIVILAASGTLILIARLDYLFRRVIVQELQDSERTRVE